MKEEAVTPKPKQPAIMTPRQKQLAIAKKRRQNWRRQVQNRVNKNEIPNPCQCGFIVFDLEGAGFLEEDITEIAAIRVSPSGDIQEIYQQLVKPITKLNRRVIAITGITASGSPYHKVCRIADTYSYRMVVRNLRIFARIKRGRG